MLRSYRGQYERYSGLDVDPAEALPYKPHIARASVWIDRPVQEVFGYIENYDNDAQWRDVVRKAIRGYNDVTILMDAIMRVSHHLFA